METGYARPSYGAIVDKDQCADDFSIPTTQLPPQLDHFSSSCGYADFHPEFAFQETPHAVSLLDMFTTQDYVPNDTLITEGNISHSGFESDDRQQQPLCNKNTRKKIKYDPKSSVEDKGSDKRFKQSTNENGRSGSQRLSREDISQYFYLPIAQAAKELKVGITLFKRRCRELGIRRWPRRKLMSLKTLIENVQKTGRDEGEEKMRKAIEILEQQKKLMEEIPNLEMEDSTKRLRQACFKAKYKTRKLMNACSESSFITNSALFNGRWMEEEDDHQFKSFLL